MLAINQPKIYKTGAALVVKALKDSSVTNIFGYPGASVLALYNELADEPEVVHCLCRHEQACVHAAEGYAITSGKPGIVLVTSGPGATNTVTGIANAYADSTPLVIIAGAANNSNGKVFQSVDFMSMVQPIVKKIYAPGLSDNIYGIIKEAVSFSTEGKKGPVLVYLQRSVLERQFEFQEQNESNLSAEISPDIDFMELASIINAALNPVFIIGGGCRNAFYELSEFLVKTNLPAVTTLMGVGNVSAQVSSNYGMIGVNGSESANSLLSKSDLIVALGVAFSDRTICKSGMFAGGTPVININTLPYTFDNVNIVKEVNCDCVLAIKKLMDAGVKERKNFASDNVPVNTFSNLSGMETSAVLKLINNYTKTLNPIIITDVGQHQMLAAKSFEFVTPKRFLTSGGMGTMGFGLPASCGVHFAMPDDYIINITGDGSFQMNIQELATVKEYKIPVKIFVMNNGYLGMIRQMQEKFFNGKYYQSKMCNPDFMKIAEGYGIKGYRVTNISELNSLMPELFASSEPAVVDCITNGYENV